MGEDPWSTMLDNMELSHVRSFTVFGCLMNNLLSLPPSLVSLDLQNSSTSDNSDLGHIGKMFLLKYLSLPSCTYTGLKLPENIGQLRNIETLDLEGTRIEELPSSVGRLQRLARLYVGRMTRFPDGLIGQMRSLEDLSKFGMSSEKSVHELSQLTNLRRLQVDCMVPESIDAARRQCKEVYSCVATLISSENLHHLYFSGECDTYSLHFPMPLESLCHIISCSLRKLRIPKWFIDKVPKWMISLGNLTELELLVVSITPEDVAILGAMPVLLFLTLSTVHGTNGRIVIRGFTGLKYFNLKLSICGTSLEFQGAMPKLEHLELKLPVHRIGCLNGVSDFGIKHLLALTKLDVVVDSMVVDQKSHIWVPNVQVLSIVKSLIGTLHFNPTISLLSVFEEGVSCLLKITWKN